MTEKLALTACDVGGNTVNHSFLNLEKSIICVCIHSIGKDKCNFIFFTISQIQQFNNWPFIAGQWQNIVTYPHALSLSVSLSVCLSLSLSLSLSEQVCITEGHKAGF